MYYQQVERINRDIARTRRAIITLGCSFVQGQGAVNDELYQEYKWVFKKLGVPLQLEVNSQQKADILARYPNVSLDHQKNLNFVHMEYDNAFCNVLASKYFEGSYAAINLGMRGNGNRGTIKELYFHPELNWDQIDEKIVIYCPSGLERFDFANDNWYGHHHWTCMWPHYRDFEPGPRKILAEGYAKRLHSEKFEIIEQIAHAQELLTWCKLHKARLIIFSAFDRRYNRAHFVKEMNKRHHRDMTGHLFETIDETHEPELKAEVARTIELFPWEHMITVDGVYPTFADLCMGQEFPDWEFRHFFEYNGKSSPNNWITSCAHPSAKGHDLFAKKLHEHITKNIL